jgi:hypothetical protein
MIRHFPSQLGLPHHRSPMDQHGISRALTLFRQYNRYIDPDMTGTDHRIVCRARHKPRYQLFRAHGS